VRSVLRQVLEADEVGVLVADHLTLDKEVVLLMHQLGEDGFVNCTSHANK